MTNSRRIALSILVMAIFPVVSALPESVAAALPELPQAIVDTTMPTVTGATITVNAGSDLQAAINSANFGDEIVLEAGATFTGTFALPDKGPGTDWIIIRSSAESSLPPPGTRVSPADAANMPKIIGVGGPVIAFKAAANAHHYRLIGLEIAPQDGLFATSLNRFTWSNHHIIFDRVYGYGNNLGGRRFASLNGQNMAVIDSNLSNWWEAGADAQALWWVEGKTHLIHNNFMEASAENIMIGGTSGWQELRLPSDITITNNTFTKRLSWWAYDPSYDGINRTVKNLLEFKIGRRILVQANTFTQFWREDQSTAINIKSTNQPDDCLTPFSQVEHVTFRYNTMNGVVNGIVVTQENLCPNGELDTQHLLIENNLFLDINLSRDWGSGTTTGNGRFMEFGGSYNNVIVRKNTVFTTGANVDGAIIWMEGDSTGFVFENNIVGHARWGVRGSGLGIGDDTLETIAPGARYEGNVQFGESPSNNSSNYPAGQFYPTDIAAIDFVDYRETGGGNYRLADTSPYKNAGTDGKDPGVDWDAFDAIQDNTGSRPAAISDFR